MSGLALFAAVLFAGDDCVACDQEIATTAGSTTTIDPAGPSIDESEAELRIDVDQGIDLQGFSAVGSSTSASSETTRGEGDTVSDETVSDETVTDETASDETGSDETASDETTSSTSESGASTTTGETAGTSTSAGTGDGSSGDGTGTGTGDGSGDGDGAATTTSAAPAAPPPVGSNVPVSGSKIYVDPRGGNAANDGTSETKALKSLQNALRRVQPGQTVYLMSGEYRETKIPGSLHFFIKNSGRADSWIRITNAPGHNPVIVANSGTGLLIEANYIEVSGLTVRGEGFSSGDWGVGISIGGSHHVRVLNSRISGMPVSGIGANESSNVHLINNVVYENSFWSPNNGSGISFFHQRNHGQGADYGQYHDVVIGNRVFRNENKVNSKFQAAKGIQIKTDGNGIIIDSNKTSGYSGRTLIANNLAYDNGGRGIIAYDSNRVDILFNTTYHNLRTPDLINGGSELVAFKVGDVKVEHNIAWARSGKRAFFFAQQSNSASRGNVFVTDQSDSDAGGSDTVTTGNPGLRSPSTNGGSADFRPSPGGGLIGKAAYTGTVSRDIVGTSRGGGVEPGAFEAEASSGR